MDVVDTRPHGWFLLGEGDRLFLDMNCNHNAYGYSVLLELSPEERKDFESRGRVALDELAEAVQNSVPLLAASQSPYRERDLEKLRGDDVTDAVFRWRREHPEPRQ